jgi:Ser/Thr protein kinase RdoA (MazF antagonist)
VEPRVHERDGFAVTFWTYYEQPRAHELVPAEYADRLRRLHAGMRELDIAFPHFTERVADAERLVASRDQTPALAESDRELLIDTLRSGRRAVDDRGSAEQLLHGEPHPGNVLTTPDGPVFIDFETCCHGPIEFDVALCRTRSARTTPTSIETCCTSVGGSFSPWSQHGVGTPGTSSRTDTERAEPS